MTKVFDTRTGEVVGQMAFEKSDRRVFTPGVCFSPDGNYLATCDYFNIIVSLLFSYGHSSPCTYIC
jgi:hypothetical protein